MMKTMQPRRVMPDATERVSHLAGKFLDEVSRHFAPSLSRDAIECSFSIVEPPLPESFYTEPMQGYAVIFIFNFAGEYSRYNKKIKYSELTGCDAEYARAFAREVIAHLALMKYLQD